MSNKWGAVHIRRLVGFCLEKGARWQACLELVKIVIVQGVRRSAVFAVHIDPFRQLEEPEELQGLAIRRAGDAFALNQMGVIVLDSKGFVRLGYIEGRLSLLAAVGKKPDQHTGVGEDAPGLPVDEHRPGVADDHVEGQQIVVTEGPRQGEVGVQELIEDGLPIDLREEGQPLLTAL